MSNDIKYKNDSSQLQFASGAFPMIAVNDHGFKTVAESAAWVQTNLSKLEEQLSSSGAILFRGFPLDSAETFDQFSASFGYSSFTYQESLSNAVRVNLTDRVFTANEAPKDVEIFLHHEMAQTPLSPDRLFFFCNTSADQGGATPICRSDQLFNALNDQMPELANKFETKGLKYTTRMPCENNHESGQGRSWKSTLSVDNREQAELKLKELGYSWQWMEDGGLHAITPILPAVKELDNGIKVFYNQLVAAYMGWEGVRENPSAAITFGDDSEIPISGLELIVELSKQFTYDLEWQDGDMALIDNRMTMHGRRPFSGDRKRQILVALAT